jgi:hypothetical protein
MEMSVTVNESHTICTSLTLKPVDYVISLQSQVKILTQQNAFQNTLNYFLEDTLMIKDACLELLQYFTSNQFITFIILLFGFVFIAGCCSIRIWANNHDNVPEVLVVIDGRYLMYCGHTHPRSGMHTSKLGKHRNVSYISNNKIILYYKSTSSS